MAVIKFDSIAATPLVLVDDKFIIQSKLALRCARQIGTHLDVAIDVGPKHVSLLLRIGICGKNEKTPNTFRTHT
jgi:hypothetical protein